MRLRVVVVHASALCAANLWPVTDGVVRTGDGTEQGAHQGAHSRAAAGDHCRSNGCNDGGADQEPLC